MGQVDNMQKQMGYVNREMEILRKNQKEMLEIKNTVTEIKNAFNGLIGRVDMAEERISEFQDMSIVTSKTKKQREKILEKKNRTEYPQIVVQR